MARTDEFSTAKISETLIYEIKDAIKSVKSYGSIEIYVQDGVVTQITIRNIKKTNGNSRKRGR